MIPISARAIPGRGLLIQGRIELIEGALTRQRLRIAAEIQDLSYSFSGFLSRRVLMNVLLYKRLRHFGRPFRLGEML